MIIFRRRIFYMDGIVSEKVLRRDYVWRFIGIVRLVCNVKEVVGG